MKTYQLRSAILDGYLAAAAQAKALREAGNTEIIYTPETRSRHAAHCPCNRCIGQHDSNIKSRRAYPGSDEAYRKYCAAEWRKYYAQGVD